VKQDLPTGTVTFLFTDIEGSTRLLRELGEDGYGRALAEHRRLIRDACVAEGGVEVDTQGDAFFFAFRTASTALAAASAFTRRLADGPILVRVGVHTGTPLVTDEGYIGHDVHRAARIAASASGGQIVLSAATRTLVDERFTVLDLGEHRFKDLASPERVFQLGPDPFPPLRSLFRTNLPAPANPLIGRKKELVDVLRLLADDAKRVVTITGTGGIGKTRFAIAAAAEGSDAFPDGVWFIDLSPVRDAGVVLPTVAHAIGATGDLAHYLHGSTSLLVVDNFEQVVDAATDLAELVAACPGVHVLITSREPLRIEAEHEYALRPLPESPAVELFRHRASAVVPDLDVAYGQAVEICERLDRLPLAIELAAARVRVLPPHALLERLEDRLPLLVTRARDVPERQQALHATIAWSYELLKPEEQRAFRRMAVFRGGATLEAIEAIVGADPDLVESLVEKSLVRLRRERFVMLETIREFARNELEATTDVADVRRRHSLLFAEVAESANLNAGLLRPGGQRLDIAIAEQDNIRAALSWCIASGDVELGLRLATAMEQFWVVSDPHEGKRWFATLLDGATDDVDPALLAQAFRSYASASDISGEFDRARELCERSLALHEELGDEHGRAVLLHRLGIMAMREGDLARARELVETSHAIHEGHTDTWGLAQTIGTLGAIERDAGNAGRAYELIAESADLSHRVGVLWWHAGMLIELGALSLEAGRLEDAERNARESLELTQQMGDYGGRVFGVGVLACVAAKRGELERAGRLWGAIEEDRVGAPLGGWLRHRATCAAHIEARAGPALDAAIAAGREWTLQDAVEYAVG
jgi:predicted ATPase/class 3 adenylate cyclase